MEWRKTPLVMARWPVCFMVQPRVLSDSPGHRRTMERINQQMEECYARDAEARYALLKAREEYQSKMNFLRLKTDLALKKLDGGLVHTSLPSADMQAFYSSDTGQQVRSVRIRLAGYKSNDPNRQQAANSALRAGDLSQKSFFDKEYDEAGYYAAIANQLVDIALSAFPPTGFLKSGLEFASGRNFITGKDITVTERAFAGISFVAGAFTLGFGTTFFNGVKLAIPFLQGAPKTALGAATLLELVAVGLGSKLGFRTLAEIKEAKDKIKIVLDASKAGNDLEHEVDSRENYRLAPAP